ncbi:unnamed protein product, partial [Mesorhabditis spiculigera]
MPEGESFYSNDRGCEQYEVFLVLSVAPLAILLRNLALPWIFLGQRFSSDDWGFGLKFFLDFLVVVVPTLLAQSFFANSVLFMLLLLLGLSQKIIEEHHQPTTFVTYFRAMVLVLTGIAILAVDFRVFPRSVMDVGVAAFVYMLAISRQVKTQGMKEREERYGGRFRQLLTSSTAVLIYLGLGRTFILKALEYQESVSEYGVHWNFFYTFFVIQVVSRFLGKRWHLLIAVLFSALHQLLLGLGNEEWILADNEPRDTLISANREGICSLMGYIALYYFASSIGKFITTTGCRIRNWLQCNLWLYLFAVMFFFLQKGSEMAFGLPSRRITNLPYIFSQLCILTYSLGLCLSVQMVALTGWAANMPHFGTDEKPWSGVQPCLLTAVNKAGIAFFLLGNVLTGIVNMSTKTSDVDDASATGILIVYNFVCCGAASWSAARRRRKQL